MATKQIRKLLLLLVLLEAGEDLGPLHEVPQGGDGVVLGVAGGCAAALRFLLVVVVVVDVCELAVLLGIVVVHQVALNSIMQDEMKKKRIIFHSER